MRTRALCAAALLAPLLLLTGGCGIRTTQVPVDAGPAPSRVPCETPDDVATQSGSTLDVHVYLVCRSQLVAVNRSVRLAQDPGESDGLQVAQTLLAELQKRPSDAESDSNLTTSVDRSLRVRDGRGKDPADALRLSREPMDLTAYALAQLICTYAGTVASDADGTVLLGGPSDAEPRRYACTEQLKSAPEAVPTLGTERP
ncbi:hypothetical protein [Streptomyces sp. GC420]|uniref:hypothetical protein n=1 Tax=Streptomyces sp. GC420 TaxID=2697568 RepID=UPI001414D5CD|nr:hypothetical protein [Streptomyces sp. GC420]NBM15219.1 hypothetical protein [Streptomyces sp. GC420]